MIRLFDIFFSFFGIILLSPIFLIIFLISFFDTYSPLFYQERIGLNEKKFILVKFRTMKLNTPSSESHLIDISAITKFGFFIRLIKLDELPQLWNVLKGDMSFVGPRPCLFSQKKLIDERIKYKVFEVRPGITGLAQISGITMKTPRLLAYTDAKMISNMNLLKYYYYILFTFLKVFKLIK